MNNSAPKLFFPLDELSLRWSLSRGELMAQAVAGDLPVMIFHYSSEQGNRVQVMRRDDPEQYPEMLHPEWGASLNPNDLTKVAQHGETNINCCLRYVESGLETISYDPSRKITTADLVVVTEHVEFIESGFETVLGESERIKLLKIIAAMGLAIAGNKTGFYYGEFPNSTSLAKHVFSSINDCPPYIKPAIEWSFVEEDSMRKTIGAGMKLLLPSIAKK